MNTTTTNINLLIEAIRNEDEYMPLARRCDSLNRTHRDLLGAIKNLKWQTEAIADNARQFHVTSSHGEIMESPRAAADKVDRLMMKQNADMTAVVEIAGMFGIDYDVAELLIDVVLVDAANGLRF